MQTDDTKLRELILYLSSESRSDRAFGATKLNKLLFFCDFTAFDAWGKSITGHRYQKLPYGPAPIAILPVLRRMEQERCCQLVERTYCGRQQRVVVALRDADVDVFDPHELQLVQDVLSEYRSSNGRQVSDLSHDFVGWQMAELNEEIPYETVYMEPPRELTPAEAQACLAAAAG